MNKMKYFCPGQESFLAQGLDAMGAACGFGPARWPEEERVVGVDAVEAAKVASYM